MNVRNYLPSAQFSLLIVSVAMAGGLVAVAKQTTDPQAPTRITSTATPQDGGAAVHWEETLQAVQTESGVPLPTVPDQNTVAGLRQAAQTSNLTDSVSRTLLVNLTNAKAQGLGNDIPTQNQLVASAIGQIDQQGQHTLYTQNDVTVVADTPESQHAYGNALAVAVAKNAKNDYGSTMILIDNATSQDDSSQLTSLKPIAADYRTLVSALLQVPVPKTMEPFHLQLVNNFQKIADTYTSIATIVTDPIKGLSAVKDYQSLTQATVQVFINIAQALGKNGILFTKDEPGSAWGILLSAQQ